jgi:hypothetical protein
MTQKAGQGKIKHRNNESRLAAAPTIVAIAEIRFFFRVNLFLSRRLTETAVYERRFQ